MENTLIKTDQMQYELSNKRIRIFIKPLYKNHTLCNQLSTYMLTVKGVRFAQANPITGKILVIFDKNTTNLYRIGSRIRAFVQKNYQIYHDKKVIDIENLRQKQNGPIEIKPVAKVHSSRSSSPTYAEASNGKTPYYTMTKKQIELRLKTDATLGLAEHSISNMLKQHGHNVLSEKNQKAYFVNL